MSEICKHEYLVFKVRVHDYNPQLFALLKEQGKYYGSRKLVELAMFGLAVQQGRIGLAPAAPSVNLEPSPSATRVVDDPRGYPPIYDAAGDMISDLFDVLEAGHQ